MNKQKQYYKKPTLVEVMEVPEGGISQGHVVDWIKASGGVCKLYDGWVQEVEEPFPDDSYYQWRTIFIRTSQGTMTANPGDFVVKERGLFYVQKPEEFDANFEEKK